MENEPRITETTTPPPAPPVAEDQLKMPEEDFTAAPAPSEPRGHGLLYTLLALLIVLLGVLAVVLMWGDQLLEMFMPATQAPLETPIMPENTVNEEVAAATTTVEQDLDAMDTELDNVDFAEMDAELDAIDAELEAEAQ